MKIQCPGENMLFTSYSCFTKWIRMGVEASLPAEQGLDYFSLRLFFCRGGFAGLN